jgi:F0F1-type ATP synthase assembly protein I
MPDGPPNPKDVGNLFAFAQVGFEMVAPIVLGLIVDKNFDTAPWGVVCGTVLGLVGGLWHLVLLSKRFDEAEARRRRDKQ